MVFLLCLFVFCILNLYNVYLEITVYSILPSTPPFALQYSRAALRAAIRVYKCGLVCSSPLPHLTLKFHSSRPNGPVSFTDSITSCCGCGSCVCWKIGTGILVLIIRIPLGERERDRVLLGILPPRVLRLVLVLRTRMFIFLTMGSYVVCLCNILLKQKIIQLSKINILF